ncbi:GDT1-like protein 2, chloroplastic [Triticum dicoccoides]|uniref:GDT1-like protein 2, chloroplastic n=1 Tax=Triticum dicoccoides TaxID=85692 RepID=UPI00188EB83D|nr:GDT1-like protein 2, chloroplastic [Triticum dicoccoides]
MASGACGHFGLAAPRRHALLLPAPAAPPCLSQRAVRRRNTARLACAGASGLEFSHPPPPRHYWTAGVGAQVVSSCLVRCRLLSWLKPIRYDVRVQTSSVDLGAGSYEGDEAGGHREQLDSSDTKSSNEPAKPVSGSRYMQAIAAVLLLCALASAFIIFFKGQPSAVVAALAKSGFTAAFTLIFVSEIGDKTFFIAALLAMQYQKALVLLGSMAALSLMTIVSVVIGRIFQSVPAQFQTTLPIGEYAAVALLAFFGFKSIKDAWALPDKVNGDLEENSESGELAEAEELVKEKASLKITSPLAILWKSFSLVFFAEWGDRSMLATIALGAAQSPLGVASGAIAGHLVATLLAIIGGAFLANYLSEKLVGLLGGVLFLLFAAATLFGVF